MPQRVQFPTGGLLESVGEIKTLAYKLASAIVDLDSGDQRKLVRDIRNMANQVKMAADDCRVTLDRHAIDED